MDAALRLDVYPTDADAFEAVGAFAAERLRAAAASGRATVALAGGRSGRGVMVALAGRSDVPWDRIEWFWSDERCVPADDPRSNVRLARESLLGPRGVAAARIHAPPGEPGDPEAIAAAYAGTLAAHVNGGPMPAFDLVLLGIGARGSLASLAAGCGALGAATAVAPVAAAEVADEPRVARVTLTPPVLRAARHVIVTATGESKAAAVAAAMREPFDPARVPAQLVRPAERVTWIIDQAAAAELLRDARPAQ